MQASNLIVTGDAIFNGRVYGLKVSDLTWKTKLSAAASQYYKIGSVDIGSDYESFSGLYNVSITSTLTSTESFNLGIVQVNLAITRNTEAAANVMAYTDRLKNKFEFIVETVDTIYNLWIKVSVPNIICTFQNLAEASRSVSGNVDNKLSIQINDDANWSPTAPTGTTISGTKTGVVPNSEKAYALAESRSLKVNLSSDNPASFDGSGDATIGVTGVLPISHGGTGNTTGEAESAKKAAADGSGNNIEATYLKDITIDGTTVTLVRGNGTTETRTTQDTDTITSVKGNAETSYRTGQVNLTPANIGALAISGGTMTGQLVAQANTAYTTAQVRNITMSTSDPSGGTNGQIHFKYS